MKTNILLNTALLALAVTFAGCATQQSPHNPAPAPTVRYGDPTELHAGRASALTVSDFNRGATDLVDKMLADPSFKQKLNALALPAGTKPVLVMRSIENNTPKRIQQNLDAMSRDMRIKLRKSGQFDFKDDTATQTLVDRIMTNADGGLESGNLLSQLQTHASPNYILTGEVVLFEDPGNRHTFKLYLTLHALGTNPGAGGIIAWEDVCEIVKYGL